jgi:prepilin-type processing-associated H-X9-DG protein/prepilin-type N-terminal cleavage/methylation domain-containing protein
MGMNRRRHSAFTLVELLVVVGIIALLVTILMPTLGRALDLARKTVCGTQIGTFGRGSMMYVQDHNSYPPMGDWRFSPGGWPKFYGVMQAMGIKADSTVRGIYDFSKWELDECWEKAFCPAMDYTRIIRRADEALVAGGSPLTTVGRHRVAAGYQWNVVLRAAGQSMSKCPSGRWSTALWQRTDDWWTYDNTQWIDYPIFLPNDGIGHITQAVNRGELELPASVAEAWDSMDFETLPNVTWASGTTWKLENLCPGWHVGPHTRGTRGWAVLNGHRHPGSPNILYADGHVAADATKVLSPSDMGDLPGGNGSWEGMKLNSWDDFHSDWGTLHHIVPETRITQRLE